MLSKPAWIIDTPISLKKYVFFTLLCAISVTISWITFTPKVALWITILCWLIPSIGIVILAITKGISYVQTSFQIGKESYRVQDNVFPLKPIFNNRSIARVGKNAIESRIFLEKQKEWAMFDIVRKFAKNNQFSKRSRALVLGGGGGAIPLMLAESFNMRCDVVEISEEMIQAAKNYFLPLKPKAAKNITFIQSDAINYILKLKKKYDFIVVDVFSDGRALPAISEPHFIRQIQKLGNFVFVNFCVLAWTPDVSTLLKPYLDRFTQAQIYLTHSNLVGFFSSEKLQANLHGEKRIV